MMVRIPDLPDWYADPDHELEPMTVICPLTPVENFPDNSVIQLY